MDEAGGHYHLFESQPGTQHALLADGSRVYDIDPGLGALLHAAAAVGEAAVLDLLHKHGLQPRFDTRNVPAAVPMRALSLAVAQRCNLACTYCYADGGSFGSTARDMPADVAAASVRRLIGEASPGDRVNLAFMGGEPLLNRALVRETTELAARLAADKGVAIGFSLTTNGTLLGAADAEFLDRFRFAITISLDGVGAVHDRLRPAKGGRGTYQRVLDNATALLAGRSRCKVFARITVTPSNLSLRETLDAFVAAGFDAVGFSPLLRAPSGREEMQAADFETLLAQMRACGEEFERRMVRGQPYPFSNMTSALEEIHRGTHRPFPCGAGAGYLGVSADGDLFACHRFVGDEAFKMGDLARGVDGQAQHSWLSSRAVDRQEPCRTCWARYLCGGGCHYESIHRGRPACGYIRGWLDYVLGAYVRLAALQDSQLAADSGLAVAS